MLRSHSIVSSSRSVRACSPWGGRWIGHWWTTWFVLLRRTHKSQKGPHPCPICLSRSGNVRSRFGDGWAGPRCSWQGHSRGVGSDVWDENTESRSVLQPLRIQLVKNTRALCCYRQQMSWWVVRRVQLCVSIWGAVRSHPVNGWELGGAVVQSPWHGVLETVRLLCDEA